MKTGMKVIISLLALGVIWGSYALLTQSATPIMGTELAIAQVNGGNYEWAQMNLFEQSRHVLESSVIPYVLSLLALVGVWWKSIKKIIDGD
jgi:hypothetical protein